MMQTNGKKIFAEVQNTIHADAVFVSAEVLKRYVTGFLTEGGFVLVDEKGTTLYTDLRYSEAAEKLFAGTDVSVALLSRDTKPSEILKKYKKVAVPFSETSYAEYLKLAESGTSLVDAMPAFRSVMAIKNEQELRSIARACEIAEKGLVKLLPDIKEGMTETEVAALLEYNMRSFGAYSTSFDTIVAFGAHASVPHHVTGDKKLAFGDEILIDFGCKVDGYCSDITRTFLFGDDKKHDEFKKAYSAVLNAHNLVIENLKEGMTEGEGDAIARDYLKKFGYDGYFTHSLGHGVGLNIHEFPFIRKAGENVLKNGMVFSDEPGVYFAGNFGIRIEDTVTLENGKIKSFMKLTDKNLVVL